MVNPIRTLVVGLVIAVALCAQPQTPVIGIYTQDSPYTPGVKDTYIAASYVKYLEMSGAQVVPLFYNSSQAKLT